MLILSHELEIFGVAVQKIHQIKIAKNGAFCGELLSRNDFEDVFVNFCCYEYGANASEVVQEISKRTLVELNQAAKAANVIAAPIKQHI